jgi:peptidoglycan LD-endopeptidase LytH
MWQVTNRRLIGAITIAALALSLATVSTATDIDVPAAGLPAPVITASPLPGLKASELHDSFNEIHHGHRHEAIDIMRPYGTAIYAVVDGTTRKLFMSRAGGKTIYQFDTDGTYCYYYAHLDRYADGLTEKISVKHGQILGYVGTSGNAEPNAPQLHLAIARLGPDKRWWQGAPVDPYPVLLNFLQKSQSKNISSH